LDLNKYIKYGALAVLGVLCFSFGSQTYYVSKKNRDLEVQVKDLTEKEKRSAVLRSISTQMEEIAYQQKEVSDKQREEAVVQTRIANEMRNRSEIERRNALEAERNALESEQRAIVASQQAESQRVVAEQQREEAEYARKVADTLSYVALARNLGSEAVTQENTGNHDLALLLAYTSYLFTDRYKGDVYQPSIYEALSLISKSTRTWPAHRGAVKKLYFTNQERTKFLSISEYGSLAQHELKPDGQLVTNYLFQDSQYDIRDMWYFDNGVIYAISRTSDLLVFNPNKTVPVIRHIDGAVHPIRIYSLNPVEAVIVAENGLFVIGLGNLEIERSIIVERPIRLSSTDNGKLVLFDDTDVVIITDEAVTEMTTLKIPVKGVTSVSRGRDWNTVFYGTNDGTIYMVAENGQITRLVGHRSKISQLSSHPQNKRLLLSTSYDGTAKIWDWQKEKVEPVNVISSGNWITAMMMVGGEYMWTGDQRGNLTQTITSVPLMAETIKKSLTRDFTREEWNYYIGSNIPYETFLDR
jgi:WD40 repeat protein